MARSKSSLQIRLEYYPVRALWYFLARIPFKTGASLMLGLLKLILFFMPKRRALVRANLQESFPHFSSAERARIMRESFRHVAMTIAFFPRIPRTNLRETKGLLAWDGLHYIDQALTRGKGVLLLTAHYGCWEILAPFLMTRYPGSACVGRPLDNPWLDRMVNEVRTSGGGQVIPKNQLTRDGLKVLKQNRLLGILVDQNFAPGGIFVDFFGRLAATTPILAILAKRSGAVVIPTRSRWDRDRLRLTFEAPLILSPNPNQEEAIAEDTAAMTQVIERWVREDPGQWFWLHNRWKRRPRAGDMIYRPTTGLRRSE